MVDRNAQCESRCDPHFNITQVPMLGGYTVSTDPLVDIDLSKYVHRTVTQRRLQAVLSSTEMVYNR